MMREENKMAKKKGDRVIEFTEEGVIFTIPESLDHVFIKRLPTPDESPQNGEDGFEAREVVFNFKPFTDKDEINKEKEDPDPYITMQVYFTDDTLKKVSGDFSTLQLGYYDGTKWKVYKKAIKDKNGNIIDKKDNFKKQKYEKKKKDKWTGHGSVELRDLPDPLIGWGP
jgi:hypothetical protein